MDQLEYMYCRIVEDVTELAKMSARTSRLEPKLQRSRTCVASAKCLEGTQGPPRVHQGQLGGDPWVSGMGILKRMLHEQEDGVRRYFRQALRLGVRRIGRPDVQDGPDSRI